MPLRLAILVSGRGSNMSAILDAIKSGGLDASVSVVFSNNPEAKGLEIAASYGVATESLAHKGMSREAHEESVLQILSKYEIDFVVLAGYMRVLSPKFLRAFKGLYPSDLMTSCSSPAKSESAMSRQDACAPISVADSTVKTSECSSSDLVSAISRRDAGGPSDPSGHSDTPQRRPDGPPCNQKQRTFDQAELYRIINIHPSLLPSFPGAHAYEDAWEAGVPASGITVHLVDELVDHGPILQQGSFNRMPNDDIESFKARGLALEHKLFPAVLQSIAQNGILAVLENFAAGECASNGSAGFQPASENNCAEATQQIACEASGTAGVSPASEHSKVSSQKDKEVPVK